MKKIDVMFNIYYTRNPEDSSYLIIRLSAFIGSNKQFFVLYISPYFKRRPMKRNTWIFELLKNKEESIQIMEGVRREEGVYYSYKKIKVSPFLVRRIFNKSNCPERFLCLLNLGGLMREKGNME